jgi:integrase
MPRQFPSYPRKPHKSGQARIKIAGRQIYLGVHGSPASWAEYNRLLGEWRAGRLPAPSPARGRVRTVKELTDAWETWAERTQLDGQGRVKGSVRNCQFAYEPLLRIYGATGVADFGTAELLHLQEAMASGAWLGPAERALRARRGVPLGWARSHLNRATARVKALFSWGELRRLVPAGKAAELFPVRGIARGEHGARETAEVPPVAEGVLRATLPHLRPVVRAAVEVLSLTGARPSEVLGLRPCDLHKGGRVELARGYSVELPAGVWFAQPALHKTAGKGQRRVILFGPLAQAVLAPLLEGRDPSAYLFSPAEEVARWRSEQRRQRRTPVQPSQEDRGKSRPKRRPRDRYTRQALLTALKRACKRAGVPAFSPYQLRHLAATRIAEEFSPDVARVVLGQKSLSVIDVYALPAVKKAAAAVNEIG